MVILASVERYECIQFFMIIGLDCQALRVRRYHILPLNSFHRLQFRIFTLTLSVLNGQAYLLPMHQMHFTLSAVDTVSMALVCFLLSLPIDLLFTLEWTLSSRGLCNPA